MMMKSNSDFSNIIDPIVFGMREIKKEVHSLEQAKNDIEYSSHLYETLVGAMYRAVTKLSTKSRGTSLVVKPYLIRVMTPTLYCDGDVSFMRFTLEKRKTSSVSLDVFIHQLRDEFRQIIYNLEVNLELEYAPEYFQIIEIKTVFEVPEKNRVIIELMLVDSIEVENYLLHNSILVELERDV